MAGAPEEAGLGWGLLGVAEGPPGVVAPVQAAARSAKARRVRRTEASQISRRLGPLGSGRIEATQSSEGSGRRCGNRITSRMEATADRIMANRSTANASPPAGGIPLS